MKRTSLTLLAAAAFGLAGIAQAETFDAPEQAGEASTMTMGQPNLVTNNVGVPANPLWISSDTTVLGAAPATISSDSVVTTTTYYPAVVTTVPSTVYVQPNILWNPDTVVTSRLDPLVLDSNDATPTFNVPSQAGEASTMTEGVPNIVTNNDRVIVHSQVPVIIY